MCEQFASVVQKLVVIDLLLGLAILVIAMKIRKL